MSLPIFVSDFNVQSLKTNMELAVGQKLMKSIDVDFDGLEGLGGSSSHEP